MAIQVLAGVIERDGEYLVCQRPAHKRHGGLWEFPGGKLEAGESHLDAVRRELREELGVEVSGVGPTFYSVEDPGSEFVINFVSTTIVGLPQALEHSELRWLPTSELLSVELAPSDRRFAGHLQSLAAAGGNEHPSPRPLRDDGDIPELGHCSGRSS